MKRPYVIINCASSADGKIALPSRKQTRISCKEDRKRVLELRKSCDAILVGIETVLSDDPHLTIRGSREQPIRVVLDSRCRLPKDAKVVSGNAKTIVFVGKGKAKPIGENVEVVEVKEEKKNFLDLKEVLKELYDRGIRKLLVEGGGTVIWSFLKEKLFDEFLVYMRPVIIGGKTSPTIADGEGVESEDEMIRLRIGEVRKLGEGLLIKYVPV
ncbi:MAG: 2,5-diamino-6-(ribosylamino)-4(3H)-pyrimidinone 5'-phosphate reductase [Thermoplasmata archaeon]|nr:MAG: 2,5-diamino-6-(ribosylamino)-4(3H)-pyrimidinone 5'-phosphate reductase [Thermoplasmata archaeon]